MKDLWPFGVALRGEASNHLMLRWLKTVVVSDEEKAHEMRQVGTRKASESEPLLKCRNQIRRHRNWGAWGCFRMSLAGARVLARWCPAWRRREPGLRLARGTWEGGCRHCVPALWGGWVRGSAPSGWNREALSTVAASAGGPARSSGEALVIGVDAKGPAYRWFVSREQPALPGGDV
jgi:hypothetical protein